MMVSAPLAGAEDRDPLVVATWGGSYELSQRKAYGEAWEAQTGRRIEWVAYNGDLAELRAQVERGQVLWDVIDVFPSDARTGCREGLFERLPDEFDFDDLVVERPNACVAPNIIWSWLVFHEVGRFGDREPSTLEDFFDVERFPGPRALSTFPQAMLEMSLMADGVPKERVYDALSRREGVERAIRKLDSLGDRILFWSGGGEPQELVAAGEAAMAIGYNGRVSEAILKEDARFRIIWDGQVLEEEWFAITRGTDDLEGALEFVRIAATTEAQAEQAKWIPYGPMRRSALEMIRENEPWFHTGAPVLPHIPDRPAVMQGTLIADPDWWAEEGELAAELYLKWVESRR